MSFGCASVCKHILASVGDLVSHCGSGVSETGMPVHSSGLYPHGEMAFEQ